MSVVGEAYRAANALQQAAVQLLRMNRGCVREGCLVEETAVKELGSCAMHLQLIGCIQSSAHRAGCGGKAPMNAYCAHLVDTNDEEMDGMNGDGEWLYELDAIEATNPYVVANRALAALMSGDHVLCGEMIEAHVSSLRKEVSTGSEVSVRVTEEAGESSVLPAWEYVRRQYRAFGREVAAGADAGQLASSGLRYPVSWVAFHQ